MSPGVLLEDPALKEGVDKSSIDAVDDEAESKGDDVLREGLAPAIQTSG